MNPKVEEMACVLEVHRESESKANGDFTAGWDPDFTNVTEEERKRIDAADKEIKQGIYFSESDVWGS